MNFNKLRRKIILHRLIYYYPEKVREEFIPELTISDAEYDRLEREYNKLCKEKEYVNLFNHMIELDFSNTEVLVHVYPYIKKGYI